MSEKILRFIISMLFVAACGLAMMYFNKVNGTPMSWQYTVGFAVGMIACLIQ